MTKEEALAEINAVIDRCDARATPMICERIQTEAGRNHVISRIVHLITQEGVRTIGACLPHIENELDGL